MNKIEYRAVIRFLFLKKKTNDEIKIELDDVYGDSAPSLSTIKYWEVTTPEVVGKIHGMVIDDRRIRVCEIAEAVGISRERVENILHEYLRMTKLAARWVPRLLNADNKRNRVTTSKECLAMFNHNKKDF